MTIEQLLNTSAAELEAMDDKQLRAFLEPFLKRVQPTKRMPAVVKDAKALLAKLDKIMQVPNE